MIEQIPAFLQTVASFIVILSVIVFIHEFGHYWVARRCGVRITDFSIGFGKELFGWNDKRGTRWKVCLIPMGGYVKMFGDASEASAPDAAKLDNLTEDEKAETFHFKPLWKKAAIVSAGPLFNFLLTISIFTFFSFTYGIRTADPIIGEILPHSAAADAGFQAGDRIISVDGKLIDHFSDIPLAIMTNTGTPVTVAIIRKEQPVKITLTPRFMEDEDSLGNKHRRPMLGFKSMNLTVKDVGITGALTESVKQTWNLTVVTGQYLKQVAFGERSTREMKGPLGIAKMSGQATEKGLYTVLWFMALLSANLGFINLLPIPPLDGGHLLFYTVEGLRGRPMAMKFQEYGFRLGFVFVLSIMAMTVFNDVRDIADTHTDKSTKEQSIVTPEKPKE